MKIFALFVLCLSFAGAVTNPTFNTLLDQKVRQNAAQQQIAISGIAAGDTERSSLSFTVSVANQDALNPIIPESRISTTFSTSSTTALLFYQPAAGASGSVKMTVTLFGAGTGQYAGQALLSSQTFTIVVEKTDVDCGYSDYTEWSTCSEFCNGGTQSRSRSIIQQPMGNGRRCDTTSQSQTQPCNEQACLPPTINQPSSIFMKQDSGSMVVDLTGISAGLGENYQMIVIKAESSNTNLIPSPIVIYPSPSSFGKLIITPNVGQYGAANIVVTLTDSGTNGNIPSTFTTVSGFTVNIIPTAIDCQYEWNAYSSCSVTCGDGTRTRTSTATQRPSENGTPCPNPLPRESQTCSAQICPIDCAKFWGEWQPCSVSCGTGTQYRYEAVSRFAQYGGQECDMLQTQNRQCVERACPVDCVLEWDDWSSCSQNCGGGTYTRTKRIDIPPSNGGKRCDSPLPIETQTCGTDACPGPNDCNVGPWTEWNLCEATCEKQRNRAILSQAKSNGAPCGVLNQKMPCTGDDCSNARNVGGNNLCAGRCGTSSPTGCSCDSECLRYQDCCQDYTRACAQQQSGTCQGRCGQQSPTGCWCEPGCVQQGDCCSDYSLACNSGFNNGGFGGGGFGGGGFGFGR